MDIHSLHVEHTFLVAVYTLLTVVNARLHKGISGIRWFSIYNGLLFVGALLVALRGHIPNTLSIVGGNLFVVAGYIALFISLARFFGAKLTEIRVQLALAAIALVTMVQYGWLHPDTDKRLLAYSLVLCLQQAHIALFTARRERRAIHASASMAAMLGSLCVMNLWRVSVVLTQGVPQDYLKVSGGLVWMVLINTALQCGAIVSYVWMTASLLRGSLAVEALTDPLTGLLNRRAMDRAAASVLGSIKLDQPVSAIHIDLNDFKLINDTYGHACGDAILVAVSRCLQLGLRHSDFVGRMGGDEFLALLPRTSLERTHSMADSLDLALRSIEVPGGDTVVRVTASFGCAQATQSEANWADLIVACDKAMYEEKGNRRRSVTAALDIAEAVT